MTCPACEGGIDRLKVECYRPTENDRPFFYVVTCPKCEGKGYIPDEHEEPAT